MQRRWVVPVAAIVGVVVVTVAVLAVLFLTREDPGAKSVDEAVEDLRSRTTGPAGTTPPEVRVPPSGVYTAEGEGTEALSLPGISQTDGEVIPVTVEPVDDEGCWRFRVDYNEAHWQDWRFCEVDGTLVERGGVTYQRWDFGALVVENTTDFTCDPPALVDDPAAEPGDASEQSCEGTSDQVDGVATSAGPVTFLGVEDLDVGGRTVTTRHVRQARTLSGAQTGTTTTDSWIDVDSGLPVRMERTADIASDSPVGSVSYTESGWWQLTSLTPEG